MSVFGIICETNPMHNGHKYLIDQAKNMGASAVVCIMSGNTVQRGEFAVLDKYVRAEALVECGADLVIELPFPWCASSAESFAAGGVAIAAEICDTLIFGSECGNIELIRSAARIAASDEFKSEYSQRLAEGERAAELYYTMLKEKTGEEFSSNDLLGIEYAKAIYRSSGDLEIATVQRLGDGYMSEIATDEHFASAMSIRKLWQSGMLEETSGYIPSEAMSVYKKAIESGRNYDESRLDSFWLSLFRLNDGNSFASTVGERGGLINRICDASKRVGSYTELLEAVKSKRYTDSHIRRTMLHCIAGTTDEDLLTRPSESLVLGISLTGRELLSRKRKNGGIRLVTKPADLTEDLRQNVLSNRIDSVYTLAFKNDLAADAFIRMKPYIKK